MGGIRIQRPPGSNFPIPDPAKKLYEANPIFLRRGWSPRTVVVGIAPVLLINPMKVGVCTILNPSAGGGGGLNPPVEGNWGAVVNAAGNGNNQANFLDIFSYLYLWVFLSVTAVTGSWTFIRQEQNPTSLLWSDKGILWTGVDAVEELSFDCGPFSHRQAVRWVMDAAGVITFQLSYIGKSYTGGSLVGLSQSLFIGSSEAVNVNSGFELLPGDSLTLITDDSTKVFGIANTPISVGILEWS